MYKDTIQVSVFSEVLSTEETKELYANIRKSDYNISKKDNLDDLSASIILESWFNENMIS
jgi:RNase H-fold protein (predicted Holliday junction resolvase)